VEKEASCRTLLSLLALKVAKTKGLEPLAPNPVNSLLHAHLTGDPMLWNHLVQQSSLSLRRGSPQWSNPDSSNTSPQIEDMPSSLRATGDNPTHLPTFVAYSHPPPQFPSPHYTPLPPHLPLPTTERSVR
jgi:hypothetical protein